MALFLGQMNVVINFYNLLNKSQDAYYKKLDAKA